MHATRGAFLVVAGRRHDVVTKEKHISEPRINDRIRVPEVRLVGPNGEQVGIVRVEDALRLAAEADLDLVEVAPMAKPPVAKLMDFGKYKYEAAMKAREARKNQVNTVIKEFRLLQRLAEDVLELGTVESSPKQDGRNMVMVLAPTKKKAQAMAEQRRRRDESSLSAPAEEVTVDDAADAVEVAEADDAVAAVAPVPVARSRRAAAAPADAETTS
ncbi:MAG: translation initiation factor [Ornithinibacter sp.]|nr:translation initiation factor [Ornithinibacter sp.]